MSVERLKCFCELLPAKRKVLTNELIIEQLNCYIPPLAGWYFTQQELLKCAKSKTSKTKDEMKQVGGDGSCG